MLHPPRRDQFVSRLGSATFSTSAKGWKYSQCNGLSNFVKHILALLFMLTLLFYCVLVLNKIRINGLRGKRDLFILPKQMFLE
uniref:Uncharacterized protein n=1 Tax=Anguilla anguilla TaxID=7936 RepID=A0A0E9WRQ4_ANGAN